MGLLLASICGLSAATALGQSTPQTHSDPSHPASPDARQSSPAAAEAVTTATAPDLTRAEALKLVAESRRYVAHPSSAAAEDGKIAKPEVTTPDFENLDTPPLPRAETKPPAPGAGYVWVEGHYMPANKQWRWVRGEWAVPATPTSVWIPARYDTKEHKWSPGYWQPDAPPAPAVVPAAGKETAAGGKPAPQY